MRDAMKLPDIRTSRILMWLAAALMLLLTFSIFFTLSYLRDKSLDQQAAANRNGLRQYHEAEVELMDVDRALADFLAEPGPVELSLLFQQLGDLKRTADSLPYNSPTRNHAKVLLAYAPLFKRIQDPKQSQDAKLELLSTFYEQRLKVATALDQETGILLKDTEKAYAEATATRENLVLLGGLLLTVCIILAGHWHLGRMQQQTLRIMCEGTKALSRGDLEYRFRDITPDEMGQLKFDFNAMARQLQKQSEELQKVNRELRKQAKNLQEAHKHKDRFLSNMSHELRTPLNSIIGFSELLEARAGKLPPEKQEAYAKRILTAAGHLLDLITALLDLAKSGAGKLIPSPVELDLSQTILEMCDILTPLAERKKLAVKQEITPGLQITADARMVRQIFINLFSNAVKYTDHGSITVRVRENDSSVLLAIEDTGIGIPEKDQPKLFQDFYRVESADINAVEGVGIGLALSRRLAALNNGEITFSSEEGIGSTFTVSFAKTAK